MTHSGLWAAIDKVAELLHLSSSGLAKECGLDATAFNPSKRFSKYNQERWPSGKTISLVIEKSGMTELQFFELVRELSDKCK